MAVYKDKKRGTWRVVYNNTTKRGFKTKFEAQQYEAKMKLEPDIGGASMRFFDVCDDFLEHKKKRVSYPTYRKNYINIENHIKPTIGNKLIARINEKDVRKFEDYLLGLDYATTTKRTIAEYFKAIFTYSVKYLGNKNNPTIIMETIPLTDEEQVEKHINKKQVWSTKEFSIFINEVEDETYKLLFNMLYFTGIRLGESLAITWNDLNDGILSITKSITRKIPDKPFVVTTPKSTSSIRDLVLGSFLTTELEKHLVREQKANGFKYDWFIFGRDKPLSETTITRMKNDIVKKLGLPNIRLHDFRHSHATNLISDGVSIAAVSKRLGHSDINITLETYTHVLEKDDDLLLESLEKSTKKI